jgi:hypothetical protein
MGPSIYNSMYGITTRQIPAIKENNAISGVKCRMIFLKVLLKNSLSR